MIDADTSRTTVILVESNDDGSRRPYRAVQWAACFAAVFNVPTRKDHHHETRNT